MSNHKDRPHNTECNNETLTMLSRIFTLSTLGSTAFSVKPRLVGGSILMSNTFVPSQMLLEIVETLNTEDNVFPLVKVTEGVELVLYR